MNHITQILANCKVSSASTSPPYRPTSSTNGEVTPESQTRRDSWGSRILSKVKEYQNAIKVAFDRTPDSNSLRKNFIRNNFSKGYRNISPFIKRERTTSSSSVPDIITSAKLTESDLKTERHWTPNSNIDNVHVSHYNISMSVGTTRQIHRPLRYFSVNESNTSTVSISPERRVGCYRTLDERKVSPVNKVVQNNKTVKKRISAAPFLSYNGESCEIFWGNDSEDGSKGTESNVNHSLISFLAHERLLQEESLEQKPLENRGIDENKQYCTPKKNGAREKLDDDDCKDELSPIKMTIAAKPCVSYTKELEPIWMEDLNDTFSTNQCDSMNHLNSSMEILGGPCSSSTFCDDSDIDTSSRNACKALEDSGFENNASALRENVQ